MTKLLEASYMLLCLRQLQMNLSNLAHIWMLFPSYLISNGKNIFDAKNMKKMIFKSFVSFLTNEDFYV